MRRRRKRLVENILKWLCMPQVCRLSFVPVARFFSILYFLPIFNP